MNAFLRRLSLLWRILLSTSIAITALFALTGWAVQTYASRVSEQNLEEEVRTSLQAYEALWTARARTLGAVSRVISSMSDVRSAFMTGDQATIRDYAGELWARVSQEDAIFLVLSPNGTVIASLGGDYSGFSLQALPLHRILKQFPNQVSGFVPQAQRLFYVVLTPVYVQSGSEQGLLNILAAGFEVNRTLAGNLKQTAHGDFAFLSSGRVVASTLDPRDTSALEASNAASNRNPGSMQRLNLNGSDYLVLRNSLNDVDGAPVGELCVVRSFDGARRALSGLQRNVAMIWFAAVLVGLGLTYLLARRIMEPLKIMDRAASEVARHNYDYRIPVDGDDELGRLARTFNGMCDSIRSAREELIRHERISTIGRLMTSIVHDLRNPLAAIYGGAEMLVDSDLAPQQSKRLASSIYRASRRIQEMLQDLVNVSRGKTEAMEVCRLADVVNAARTLVAPAAEEQKVIVTVQVPVGIELPLGRARMERVFFNLMNNAVEAMPQGGVLAVVARQEASSVFIEIDDTGSGIPEQARADLFKPFVSVGKRNGLGLGLALSRQTTLDHGGDLWLGGKAEPGALFCMRLPLAPQAEANRTSEAPARVN